MVRRGMVTIGVAVQAETFYNDSSSCDSHSLSSSSSVPSSSSTKSAIFLPPSPDGSPQTLKITIAYNKETNLPEIIVNLDGDSGKQNKYLELKELTQGENSLASLYAPKPQQGRDLQVFYFDKIDTMDDSQQEKSQIIEVPAITYDSKERRNSKNYEHKNDERRESISQVKANGESSKKNEENSSDDSKKSMRKPSIIRSSESESGDQIKHGKHDKRSSKHENENSSSSKSSSSKENGNGHEKVTRRKGKAVGHHVTFSPDRGISSPTKDISDKSKIPVIHSSATGFMPSCEYYRQKWLQEVGCDYPCESWTNHYGSIQKTAGQKVVNKLTAQQKQLEEQAAAHRKRTEFVYHEELGFCEVPEKIPLRKKQTRLEPLRTVPKCY